MALPFYVLQATASVGLATAAPILLGAQTVGALVSNPLWGWWGDQRGKSSLLATVSVLGLAPPALTLAWMATDAHATRTLALSWFVMVFGLLGAAGNGGTIAQLGYLMEISPDDRRPAYSGYFNALVAPATLLPLLGAVLVNAVSLQSVFAVSALFVMLQIGAIHRLRVAESTGRESVA